MSIVEVTRNSVISEMTLELLSQAVVPEVNKIYHVLVQSASVTLRCLTTVLNSG